MKSFLHKNKKSLSTVISSFSSVILSLFANWLYAKINNWIITLPTDQTIQKWLTIVLFIIIFAIFIFSVFIISKMSIFVENRLFPENIYDEHLQKAFIAQKAMFAKRQEELQNEFFYHKNREEIQILQASSNIQFAIDCCYAFFEKAYTDNNSMVSEIRFEVTFMTLSYKDEGITVPYSCNKERRQPNSMLSRENNPDLYNETETAKIYKEYNAGKKPRMKLIEDTKTEGSGYSEVYEGQKNRIQSTVIFPVFSHRNELLGTIVVHCDKANFFKRKQYRFWEELLEIFSVDIGYFKLLLDYYQKNISMDDKIF